MYNGVNPFDLTGRTALVTGAGRGIGLAIAKGLAQAGARVIINGRDEEVAYSAAQGINNAAAMAFDITNSKSVETAFQKIEQLDILINNVGVRDRKPIDDFTLDDFRALLDANLVSAFDLSRHAAKQMKAKSKGRIINVTSIVGQVARPGDAIYTATKAALGGLTLAMAAEYGPHGITVNAIAPGYVATETNASMIADPVNTEFLKNRTALGRWAEPEELAGAATFLASDAASYITGHVMTVDGGFTAHF
jgi:gluconate 5-dehydrogenase